MTFNFLGPGLTVNVEAKVKEQIILDSSGKNNKKSQEAPPAEKNKNGGEGGILNSIRIN